MVAACQCPIYSRGLQRRQEVLMASLAKAPASLHSDDGTVARASKRAVESQAMVIRYDLRGLGT